MEFRLQSNRHQDFQGFCKPHTVITTGQVGITQSGERNLQKSNNLFRKAEKVVHQKFGKQRKLS